MSAAPGPPPGRVLRHTPRDSPLASARATRGPDVGPDRPQGRRPRVLAFAAARSCARPPERWRRPGRIGAVPSADLRAIVEPFMLLLQDYRAEFDQVDPTGRVRHLYESLRCWLHQAGFRVSGGERRERARDFRRLGEIAERAGDPVGALRFYRAALASHPRVGVTRRVRALERAGWVAGHDLPVPPASSPPSTDHSA